MKRFNPNELEVKWQKVWQDERRYEVIEDDSKPKMYVSGMFPYPSGSGLHSGHAFSYTIVDTIARFYRAHGNNVLNPMGWDTFGLPAENYAIKTGTAPAKVTAENIANFKRQFTRMGVSIDWSREINTSDPEYYKWTQWVFTEFFKRDLAYQKESMQWWCPVDKTVLANEQVEAGKCWRCGNEVEKKSMTQWFFKITNYADALLEEIPDLDWPDKIKTAQTNWIGKSEGAEIEFSIDGKDEAITVFSTRPDTLFGATFLVIAPEHPFAKTLTNDDTRDTVDAYIKGAIKKSEIERASEGKEKTGVFTGSYAINPVNGEKVAIWIADYVLGGYGTGAVMGVPGHDERDYEFASKFKLPVIQVVASWHEGGDHFTPDNSAETIHRKVIDAVITDGAGNYLLETTSEGGVVSTHFVGGGIEDVDDVAEAAVRREVLEETGYGDVLSVNKISPVTAGLSYRPDKKVNHHFEGAAYEVVLASLDQVASEIDEGKHTVEWVKKEDVAGKITWQTHLSIWSSYLNANPHNLYVGEGKLINSERFDGMSSSDAREEIVAWLEQQSLGRTKTTYKMRDWLISRQR